MYLPTVLFLLAAGDTTAAPVVAGALSADRVDDAVRRQRASVQPCAAGASGVVVLGWQISPEGTVDELVVISTSLAHPNAESCLRVAVGAWRFPATHSGVTLVSCPFVFGDAERDPSPRPLPRAVIDDLIARRHRDINDCGDRDSSGILELRWSVAPAGRVTDVEIVHSELHRRVGSCVARKIAGWRFPPSRARESVDVSYCFVFQPYGSDDVAIRNLEESAVEEVVAAGHGALLGCYESELATAPHFAAELEITWTISPDGHVTSAAITKQTIHHPRLERCLLATVSGWRFPAFTGEPATVTYPYYFAPLYTGTR